MSSVVTHQVGDDVLIQIPTSLNFVPHTATILTQPPTTVHDGEVLMTGTKILGMEHESYYTFGGLLAKIKCKHEGVHVLLRGSFKSLL